MTIVRTLDLFTGERMMPMSTELEENPETIPGRATVAAGIEQ
jgi:hypothetical protein